MKIMQISLNIDVANVEQVEALEVFMRTLGNHSSPVVISTKGGAVTKTMTKEAESEEEEESAEDKAKADRKKRADARKAKELEAKKKADEEEEEDFSDEEEEETEEEEEIDIATLRTLTAEKSADFRAEIKARLAKYGVSNVSSIPESKYQDYFNFITKLK